MVASVFVDYVQSFISAGDKEMGKIHLRAEDLEDTQREGSTELPSSLVCPRAFFLSLFDIGDSSLSSMLVAEIT